MYVVVQEQAGSRLAVVPYTEQGTVNAMEVCGHPKFEKLVRLVYDARLQGEDPQRRRVLEAQKASAVEDLEAYRRQDGSTTPDPEADQYLVSVKPCSAEQVETGCETMWNNIAWILCMLWLSCRGGVLVDTVC